MTDVNKKALYLAQRCMAAGMTAAGAAGVLANVEAESAFISTNVQDSYERIVGSDETYTARVDNGSYKNFAGDAAGYGLAQWTAVDRKAQMLNYFQKKGVSIGDYRTQVEYLIHEMRGYAKAWNTCTKSQDPYECGYTVCKYYEIPADTEGQAQYRGNRARSKWYGFIQAAMDSGLSGEAPATQPVKEEERDEEGIRIEKTWPPRMLQEGKCSGWPEVWLLQAAICCHGINTVKTGIYGSELTQKVKTFQKAAFPEDPAQWDGIVGPRTWAKLLELK